MPITASAKKASRQNARHKTMNRIRKDAVRSAVKTYRKLVAEKKPREAAAYLATVYQTLDKVAKSGTIKKNKADRLKSRLAALLRPQTKK